MEPIKIGRREVSKELFIQSVANAKTLADISRGIGFNPIPTTTKQNIKAAVSELGLNTSHIRGYNRTARPEVAQARVKTFKLSKSNAQYLNGFLNSLAEQSRATYKASCGNFLEEIGTNDFARVSPKRVMEFVSKKKTDAMRNNVAAHIRSMMIFCVSNNINEAKETVSKDMLIWLISK
jgi:hypothetical protein